MNRIYIEQTTFIDHPSGDKTFGFRMFDDADKWYDNNMDKKDFDKATPLGILRYAFGCSNEVGMSMFDYAEANDKTIYVNDVPFTHKDWRK